jgi:hypothetical protein
MDYDTLITHEAFADAAHMYCSDNGVRRVGNAKSIYQAITGEDEFHNLFRVEPKFKDTLPVTTRFFSLRDGAYYAVLDNLIDMHNNAYTPVTLLELVEMSANMIYDQLYSKSTHLSEDALRNALFEQLSTVFDCVKEHTEDVYYTTSNGRQTKITTVRFDILLGIGNHTCIIEVKKTTTDVPTKSLLENAKQQVELYGTMFPRHCSKFVVVFSREHENVYMI